MIKLPAIIGMVIALSSCTHVSDREGTHADVYPIEYTMGFDLNDVASNRAAKELDSFIDQYWSLIIAQPITLTATTPKGYRLASETQKDLLKRGVEPSNIVLKEQRDVSPYDFEISIRKYHVNVPVCTYHSINNYDQGDDGCYTEGVRWPSMVRPERMIIKDDLATTVSE
jgi:hypothetical protein